MLSRYIYELNLSSPSSDHFLYLKFNLGQFFVFDLEEAGELIDNELTVHIEINLSSSEFDASAYAVECSLILCLIIGRDTKVLVSSLNRSAVSIGDIHPDPGRTRIVSSSSVSIDFQFHRCVFD